MKEKEKNDIGSLNQLFPITGRSGWIPGRSSLGAIVPLSHYPLVPLSHKESDNGSIDAAVPCPPSPVPFSNL